MLPCPKILVLDDDEDDFVLIRDIIGDHLSSLRCQITWKDSGKDLEEAIREQDFDIAVVDYRLGSDNGLELGKQIRQLDPVVSIIILTGAAPEDLSELDNQASGLGASDFLSKRNLDPLLLAKSIRYALERSHQMRSIYAQKLQLEEVLQSNSLALWSENVDDGSLFYSDAIKPLSGYSKEALESGEVRWLDCILEEDRRIAADLRKEALEKGRSYGTYRIQSADGKMIRISETIRYHEGPVHPPGYRLKGRLQDITLQFEREEHLRLLANSLEQSSEGVLITDTQLEKPGPHIVFANAAMTEISGYSREELLGNTPRIFQGPGTDRSVREELKRCCREGREFTAMTANYRKDGSEYFVEWRIRPLRDPSGKITNFISTQRDVTEEHLQRIELERSESFLREIGAMALIGGWRYEKGSESVYWSEQTYKIHGLDPGEPVPLNEAFSFFMGTSRERIKEMFNACLENGIPYDVVLRLKTKQGRLSWTRAKGEPLFRGSEVVGAWGVFQDITNVYNMEAENRTFYDLAIELSCTASKDGYFKRVNKRWEEFLGWTTEELLSRPVLDFVHPDDRKKTEAAFNEVLEAGTIYGFENRLQHRNGKWLHYLWNGQLGPDGETVNALARDISDRKARELELAEALKKAHVASTAKNQFLMVMSHELRTPLNPIMANADLLLEMEADSDNRLMLHLIKDSARHLTSLIGDILDLSSIEAGRISLQRKPFPVLQTIHSTVDLLRSKAVAKILHLEVICEGVPDEETGLVCLGDKRKFRQILLNLLGNSIKFTKRGQITLHYGHIIKKEKGIAVITIQVRDTGIGIPEDELDKVFERFYQVSMTQARAYQGQGLGLSLSRELARIMGGDITVASDYGKGSTFTLTLPLEVVGTRNPEIVSKEWVPSGRLHSYKDLNVLVVEDDPVNQLVLKQLLKRLGATFRIVINGQEALGAAKEERFDFILMDIQMPVMDGIEATRQIRQHDGPNCKTPIIAVTAHAVESVRESCFAAGMTDFLEKPVNLQVLRRKLIMAG